MSKLLLATERGQLVRFDTDSQQVDLLFTNDLDEGNMGLCQHQGHYYVASLSQLYRVDPTGSIQITTECYAPSPDFHQMQIYNDRIYTTVTKRNEVWVFDLALSLLEKFKVMPPVAGAPVKYKHNYNHLNNVVLEDGKFYVNLNWLSSVQYGSSGVAVFDSQFNEVERFEYGWETHDFQFMDGNRMAICGSSGKSKNLNHVYKAGLMVNGELVFEHDPDRWFCKGLCWDQNHIYLCGGEKSTRLRRRSKRSVICILNRKDYRLLEEVNHPEIYSIKGAIVLNVKN